ncbi:MAG TPA: RNA-binding domain-containing protein [Pyrinomonadaceae bacterium]|nr:RNA-binding domain-containing protein [Pyrinomonadaceae bacterium]
MLPINIDSLLSGDSSVEWERIEFKEGWNPLAVVRTLCAFANDFNNLDGGYIFVGIGEKNGKPVFPPKGLRQEEIDKIQKELLNFGNSKINPPYHPIAYPYSIKGKNILVLRALGGENRPYQAVNSFKEEDKSRNHYIRILASTVTARGNYLSELLSLAQSVPFDDRYNQQTTLADLNVSLIQKYLTEVKSEFAKQVKNLGFEMLCRQMNIVGGATENPLPKNVGLIFFNQNPAKFFPHTQIDVVKLPTGASGSKIVEKSFFGPINQQVRNALHYIDTTVIEEITIKNPRKAEADKFFNYPYQAIEELLVNAVYHRSYEVREPIEVRILPDRITIASYPGPDRSIKIEALAAGSFIARRYRNRRIGEFLKELDLTEGRGTGIPIAIKAMDENGSPQPVFETDDENSYFVSTLPIHSQAVSGVTSEVATPTLTPEVIEFLNHKAVDLLNYCITPRSRTEIQIHLQVKDVKHVRERYVYPLLSAKLIVMTDPEHPQSSNQRFKTTKVGSSALAEYKERFGKPFKPTLFDSLD